MKKIKTLKIVCIISSVLCILTFCNHNSVSAAEIEDFSKVLSDSTASEQLLNGSYRDLAIQGALWAGEYALNHPTLTAGETFPSFVIPTYYCLEAKQNITFYDRSDVQHTTYITVDIFAADNIPNTEFERIVVDDRAYIPNAINFEVKSPVGTSYFAVVPRSSSNLSLVSISDGYRVNTSYTVDILELSKDGNTLEHIENKSLSLPNMYFSDVNQVGRFLYPRDNAAYRQITEFQSRLDSNIYGRFPENIDYLFGSLSYHYNYNNAQTYGTSNIYNNYKITYCTSNNNSTSNLTKPNYTRNTYLPAVTINKNNYQNYYNNAFSNVYNNDEIDWSLPDLDIAGLLAALIPDIKGSIEPAFDIGFDSLLGDINNYLEHMPDIGYPWGSSDNNYIDLWQNLNPIVTTVPGGGGCNWITPTYPALNTVTHIAATYPAIPTNTFPTQFIDNAKDVFQGGWDFYNSLGLIAIIIPVALFGILWKFTGG